MTEQQRAELDQKLPMKPQAYADTININVEHKLISYFDWYAVTFDRAYGEALVCEYLAEKVAARTGLKVKVEDHHGNGHFTASFEEIP